MTADFRDSSRGITAEFRFYHHRNTAEIGMMPFRGIAEFGIRNRGKIPPLLTIQLHFSRVLYAEFPEPFP